LPDDKSPADPPDRERPPVRTKPDQLQREANALRANLRRRKQQLQARAAALEAPATATGNPDSSTQED
jgi:hypothetical protein